VIVLGLLGPAGAGKSSVADYLVQNYGATRYSFATPLKQFAKNALEFTDAQLYGTQAEKEAPDERYGGKSARWFLQRLGTEGARKTFGESFWTDMAITMVRRQRPRVAVFDDMRFANEARAVLSVRNESDGDSGFVWTLDSPGRETQADAGHASESEWMHAPSSLLIKPKDRGLDVLFGLVDEACHEFGIARRREISL
jgi:hypothetical protein